MQVLSLSSSSTGCEDDCEDDTACISVAIAPQVTGGHGCIVTGARARPCKTEVRTRGATIHKWLRKKVPNVQRPSLPALLLLSRPFLAVPHPALTGLPSLTIPFPTEKGPPTTPHTPGPMPGPIGPST